MLLLLFFCLLLYSLKKGDITPLLPHNGHLSTTATFFCPQGEIRLYNK